MQIVQSGGPTDWSGARPIRRGSRRELREVELEMSGSTGREDPVEHARVSDREGAGDRLVDLVTAPRAAGPTAAAPGGLAVHRLDSRLDHACGEPAPAGVDRGDPRAIPGRHQDRHTIRGHDPTASPGIAETMASASPTRPVPRATASAHTARSRGPGGKHSEFGGLHAALPEAVERSRRYENRIA